MLGRDAARHTCGRARRWRRLRRALPLLALLGLLAGGSAFAVAANTGPTIPLPNPLVKVRTQSGNVVRERVIPIGGLALPLDVDQRRLAGLLGPDVTVGVGLLAFEELPERPIVPTIEIRRAPSALLRSAPAPPLKIDLTIQVLDLGNGLKNLATVSYGYETPKTGAMPPVVRTKLLGPITSGFTDPLEAAVESPGYGGPLKLNARVVTPGLEGQFGIGLDPLPERIHFVQDARANGLDVLYEHDGARDVKLDATVDLRQKPGGNLLHVGALVERLPRRLELSNTTTRGGGTEIEYRSQPAAGKPDIEASYRDTAPGGAVGLDANVKVSGLPATLTADIGGDLGSVDFRVPDGGEVDAIDFLARNWTGDPQGMPEPPALPQPYLALATRPGPGGSSRFRAAGRLERLRSARFEQQGDAIDVTTDVGDGLEPLHASVDLDDRTGGGGGSRTALETTISPLPRQIHVNFDPSSGSDPTRVLYQSSHGMDVTNRALLATGSANGCGEAGVTCIDASIDRVPEELALALPGEGASDLSVTHSGTGGAEPDVEASLDQTGDSGSRTYAEVALRRLPPVVTGRLDLPGGFVRAAEFHACPFDFEEGECPEGTQDSLGSVRFAARDTPERTGLPPQPETAPTFVSILGRGSAFEAAGRVDDIRNVAFHQQDENDDDEADGPLGVVVDAGDGGAFDAVVDTDDGEGSETGIDVHLDTLPHTFTTCFRPGHELTISPPEPPALPGSGGPGPGPAPGPGPVVAPPPQEDRPPDPLLERCTSPAPIATGPDEPGAVPLTVAYGATDADGGPQPTRIVAKAAMTSPGEPGGGESKTDALSATIADVPASLRADVISSLAPSPGGGGGRRMRINYESSATIEELKFGLESRNSDSVCEDPRPDRRALCATATLKNLPTSLSVTQDPDDTRGDIEFRAAPPEDDQQLSIDPIRLSQVSPEPGSRPLVVAGRIVGLGEHLKAKVAPGRIAFDACPDTPAAELDSCPGIELLDVTVKNSAVGDPLEAVLPQELQADEPDGPQLSYVERGGELRARARILNIKQIAYSLVGENGAPSQTTSLRAAFGGGEMLRAYVDRDTGQSGTQLIDGRIPSAPRAINVCIRPALPADDPDPVAGQGSFCDRAPRDRMAVQARLEAVTGGPRPTIELNRLRLAKGGGELIVDGSLKIEDLAERIDVLSGPAGAILVEGRELTADPADPGAPLADVAGRIGFDLKTFAGAAGTGFPYVPIGDARDSETDERNQDPGSPDGVRNFVKVVDNAGAARITGSVPAIRRIGLTSEPCDPDDPRFPPRESFAEAKRPSYTCVRAIMAPGRPLGITLRTLSGSGEALALEEGRISSVPAGDRGLAATIASAPASLATAPVMAPVCASHSDAEENDACRPPMLSLEADKAPGQTPVLEGRLSSGALAQVQRARTIRQRGRQPFTLLGAGYEDRPKDFSQNGARVKVVDSTAGTAIRAGLKLALPRFLDLDPPTLYACKHLSPGSRGNCSEPVAKDQFKGMEAQDIVFRMIASDGQRGVGTGTLGRVKVLVETGGQQLQFTGAPPADLPHGASSHGPDAPIPTGDHHLGMVLPGHFDVRFYQRSDYRAPSTGSTQSSYYQLDARVNEPLTLGVQVFDGKVRTNRSGQEVPMPALAVRNAAGPTGGANGEGQVTGFAKPTFRVRVDLRAARTEPATGDPNECDVLDGFWMAAAFGGGICVGLVPGLDAPYVQLDLNGDPDGPQTGDPPARTIDAVVELKGAANDVHLSAFRDVDGSGAGGKGPTANFTPQARLMLKPFGLLFKGGGGIGFYGGTKATTVRGDLAVEALAERRDELRLSHDGGNIRLSGAETPSDRKVRVKTRYDAIGHVREVHTFLFGAFENVHDFETDPYHQPVRFIDCNRIALFGDGFHADIGHDEVSFPFDDPDPSERIGITLADAGGAFFFKDLANVSRSLGGPYLCFRSDLTSSAPLVTSGAPAPRFEEPGRPIEAQLEPPGEEEPEPEPEPEPEEPALPDIEIDGERIECGTLSAGKLTVKPGGSLLAGQESDEPAFRTVDTPAGPQQVPVTCDGSLTVTADEVVVEDGGEIDASGTRTTPGEGLPSGFARDGGGGSHIGAGGKAGIGFGVDFGFGRTYDTGDPGTNFGSAGGDGDEFGQGGTGGAGGGIVRVLAQDRIRVAGTVAAAGGDGTDAPIDCQPLSGRTGGGGGSGGLVQLAAARVDTTGGVVSAAGGDGGDGHDGGGGGGGGRVQVDAVLRELPGSTLDASGGDGGEGCDDGGRGQFGDTDRGLTPDSLAEVTRVEEREWVRDGVQVKVHVLGTDGAVVCGRRVALDAEGGLANPGIDPEPIPAEDLPDEDAGRFAVRFPDCFGVDQMTEVAPGEFEKTITFPLGDGHWGLFAVGVEGSSASQCRFDPLSFFCNWQDAYPRKSTVRVSSDTSPPQMVNFQQLNGTACQEGLDVLCLTQHTGELRALVDDGDGSGVAGATCLVTNDAGENIDFPRFPCEPGERIEIPLDGVIEGGTTDGLKRVTFEVTDLAGNKGSRQVEWLVDSVPPDPPDVQVLVTGDDVGPNGWLLRKPRVTVLADDPHPSSDFEPDEGITLFVDETGHSCGALISSLFCSADETAPFLPETGTYDLVAQSRDRAGNTSPRSEPETVRIDLEAPVSRLVLGPEEPDGAGGWYRTRPFFAFAASDGVGGSGVDRSEQGSGFRYSIDGGPFHDWDPADDDGNLVPEGVHDICWYAVDVAGNEEAGEDPRANAPGTNCRDDVRVDATAPEAGIAVSPDAPDGGAGFYRSGPHVDSSGDERVPGGVDADDVSGLERVEQQVDGGDWGPAESLDVAEGEHTVRARAIDTAGNISPIEERTLRVDSRAPVVRLGVYPPHPNRRGWFRQSPLVTLGATDPDGGSGVDAVSYRFPGDDFSSIYDGPFTVGDGEQVAFATPHDRAGNTGVELGLRTHTDRRAPTAKPAAVTPRSILLPGQRTTLSFRADPTGGEWVKVTVIVSDLFGNAVARLAPPAGPDGFRAPGAGSVKWNGQSGGGKAVMPGRYHFRVQATDDAGNTVTSGESPGFLVLFSGGKLGLLGGLL